MRVMLEKCFSAFALGLLVFASSSLLFGQAGSGSGIGPGKVVEGTSRVHIFSKPDAEYPATVALTSEFAVVLRAEFSADGRVRNVRL